VSNTIATPQKANTSQEQAFRQPQAGERGATSFLLEGITKTSKDMGYPMRLPAHAGSWKAAVSGALFWGCAKFGVLEPHTCRFSGALAGASKRVCMMYAW
jgi:hypothetical protein